MFDWLGLDVTSVLVLFLLWLNWPNRYFSKNDEFDGLLDESDLTQLDDEYLESIKNDSKAQANEHLVLYSSASKLLILVASLLFTVAIFWIVQLALTAPDYTLVKRLIFCAAALLGVYKWFFLCKAIASINVSIELKQTGIIVHRKGQVERYYWQQFKVKPCSVWEAYTIQFKPSGSPIYLFEYAGNIELLIKGTKKEN